MLKILVLRNKMRYEAPYMDSYYSVEDKLLYKQIAIPYLIKTCYNIGFHFNKGGKIIVLIFMVSKIL